MVVSLQTIEKNASTKKVVQHYCDYVGDSDSEYERSKLISLRQSTLDQKIRLKYFLENICKSQIIDGVYCHEEERGIKIRLGKQSSQSCGYRLSNAGVESGELPFKRNARFSETKLQKTENSFLLLPAPISHAVKDSDAVASADQNSVSRIISRTSLHTLLQ